MTTESDSPSEAEIDAVFAEQHSRAVLELAIERRDAEARTRREAAAEAKRVAQARATVAVEQPATPRSWCERCGTTHYDDDHASCSHQLDRHKQRLRDEIPRRFRGAEVDGKALAWLGQAANSDYRADPPSRGSLLLHGPTGAGKTYQMFGIFESLAEMATYRSQFAARNVPALLSSLRPNGTDEDDISVCKRADWLFLDDLTGHKATEWTEERLYELLNDRYEQLRPCVFTTNTSPAKLKDHLGDRIASRLAEMCEVVAISGPDRRRLKG